MYRYKTIFNFKKTNFDSKTTQKTIQKTAQKTTQKTTRKTNIKLSKIQKDILQYLEKNPQASRKELTENIKNATEHGSLPKKTLQHYNNITKDYGQRTTDNGGGEAGITESRNHGITEIELRDKRQKS